MPGEKFGQMFDFIGTQGVSKTTFLMKYFNSFGNASLDQSWPRDNFDWYLQGIRRIDQKDDLKEARVNLQYIDDLKINTIGFVNYRFKAQG